jgi:hypothetical protein
MKTKLLILAIAIFIGVSTVFAQTENEIASIRAEVTAINKNAKSYTKKTKSVEDVSLEGTEATFFVSGKGLKKITAKIYGETYRATLELYYQGEDLIFAYEKTSKYNGNITIKNLKVVKVEEKRLYFSGGKMIRYLFGTKQMKLDAVESDEEAYSMMELSDMMKASYSK